MSTLTDTVAEGFESLFERQPHGLWSAPGRVNLIGEHTDYNLGFVLPLAIDLRTAVALGTRSDGMLRIASEFAEEVVELPLAELSPSGLSGWSAYPLGVAWALGQLGAGLGTAQGADIYIASTVPVGAGLSSSAAIECAVAVALNDAWNLGFDKRQLAQAGQLAENKAVGAPTGIMDQSASMLGRRDHAVFLDCRSLDAELVNLGFAAAGLELLVMDTGVSHSHATGGYASRRAACESGARTLGVASLRELVESDLPRARELLDDETFRRVRHIITENQRVLDTVAQLRAHGPRSIGALLDASHTSMRNDFEISIPELDLAVETSVSGGAIGARMTGGGFGGAAIALVERDDVSRIQQEVESAFAEAGFSFPTVFTVSADEGARRHA